MRGAGNVENGKTPHAGDASSDAFPNRYSGVLHQYNKQIMEDCLPGYKELREAAAQVIVAGHQEGDRVLEIGAGQGDSAEPVLQASNSIRLDLLDVSSDMLRDALMRLQQYLGRLAFIPEDAYQYLLHCVPYHTIFSQFTVHNFTRDNKQKLFSAICSKLPNGGRFILVDKVYPDDRKEAKRMLDAQRELYRKKLPDEAAYAIIAHEDEDYYHPELRTEEGMIREMLHEAGFSVVRILKRMDRDVILEAVK